MNVAGVIHLGRPFIRRVVIPLVALMVAGANPQPLGDAPIPTGDAPIPRDGARYILMPSPELLALPTSGPAWTYIVQTANAAWPPPDFNDQNNQAGSLALAAALVYARTGDVAMRTKARDAILAVIPTFDEEHLGPGLGPLRQTAGWVLAADFIELEGNDDVVFRDFLGRVLADPTGTHSRWHRVVTTHDDASNNWGAWAGAARVAASLYLGVDVTDAANTVRGFLGDRSYWSKFNGQKDQLSDAVASWACDASLDGFTPVNGPCTKDGVDLDGAVPADISRGGVPVSARPSSTGVMYTHETLAGYVLQAELLFQHGYPDIYEFRSQAIRRMAEFISRSEAAGGPGWNPGRVQYHVPWLLNRRYGTTYPTVPAEYGRSFGFTDWLYGS